jgi:hypothetical protein
LTEDERRFATRAVRRKNLFLALSLIGIAAALGLAAYHGFSWARGSSDRLGLHVVVVILILLNARQNLRQYRYAGLLEKLGHSFSPASP